MATASPKTAALAAFTAALADPESVDWQAIAGQLAGLLAPKSKPAVADSDFAPWSDKKPAGKAHPFHVVRVTFADGVAVETSMQVPMNGRLPNVAKACRVACDFYRSRMRRRSGAGWVGGTFWGNAYSATVRFWDRHVAVPAIVSVEDVATCVRWNPATATDHTAEHRAGSWSWSEAEREALDGGMPPEEAAEWVRETFEAEARADLVQRGMIEERGATVSDRIALHRSGGLRQTFPGDHPHGWDRKSSNVIPFRRPVATCTAARALGSVAFRDAIGARPFAA